MSAALPIAQRWFTRKGLGGGRNAWNLGALMGRT